MKQKKIWTDVSFWVLIGMNAYLVFYYYLQPQIFTTLVWLYWAQSVLIGFFNFADIITIRKVKPMPITVNGVDKIMNAKMKLPGALFFLFHYGFFHFIYAFFLAGMKITGPFQTTFFRYCLGAFIIGQVVNFVQHKIQQQKEETNLTKMFMTPYLRIVPMHLTILIPLFLHVSNLGVFLILKSIADVLMYVVTKPVGSPGALDKTQLVLKHTS